MTSKDRYEEGKRNIQRDNAIFLIIVTLLGAAVVVEYWLGSDARLIALTIITFVAFSVVMVARMLMVDRMIKNLPKYLPDERMEKIEAHARSRSWYVTFLIICLLIGLTAFRIVELSTYIVLIIVFFVMGYSLLVFRWYYNRNGDV